MPLDNPLDSQQVQDAVRDIVDNYETRTIDDLEQTANELGVDLLGFGKLVIEGRKATDK